MKRFIMNGYLWKVVDVEETSPMLIDRTGVRTVAVTNANTLCIYVNDKLEGSFKTRVLLHELAHCMMFSYGYIDYIRSMTHPKHWIDMEEFIANLFANHIEDIYDAYYKIYGEDTMKYVPYHIDKMSY